MRGHRKNRVLSPWEPKLSPKQRLVYRDPRQEILLLGPRGCGKTRIIEHCVLKHLWRWPSKVAIIGQTTRTGEEGIWPELTGFNSGGDTCNGVIQEWFDAAIGNEIAMFDWAEEPHRDSFTKIHKASLYNRFGSTSEIVLFPVKYAKDAEAKLKSTVWSMVWISEADTYDDRCMFDSAHSQLRMAGVPFNECKVFVDANPPEEGESHWLYGPFKRELEMDPDDPDTLDENYRFAFEDPLTVEDFKRRQKNRILYRFDLSDNPFAESNRTSSYRSTYAYSKDKYTRYVLGQESEGSGSPFFFKRVFSKERHVIGRATGPESEWEIMAPSDGPQVERQDGDCLFLMGWDPGETNHAVAILQPWTNAEGQECYDVLDEFCSIGSRESDGPISINHLTSDVAMVRMKQMEEMLGLPIEWLHYSDGSVEDFRSAADFGRDTPKEEQTHAGIVYAASATKIRLVGSSKVQSRFWQQRRVDLFRRLLKENRIRISAHCGWTIRMCNKLRKNTSARSQQYILPGQEEKHIFDALTYPMAMRLIADIMEPEIPRVIHRPYAV